VDRGILDLVDITAFVFNGVTSSEVLAPVAAAAETGPVTVRIVGISRGSFHGFEPLRVFEADSTTDDVISADLLLVPGGLGSIRMMEDGAVLDWLRRQAEASTYVMSVSTGSLLLAAAGLLTDATASGHWLAHDDLVKAGAQPADAPITWWGKFVTTSGPMAAADVARTLPDRVRYGPRP
jgi:putative intracellular protease/amidase